MNRSAIPRIYKSALPSSRQYHFADCIPNASQRDITFCDIPHSKSFIWDELINLVLCARARAHSREREEQWKRGSARRHFTRDAAANRGEIISLNYVIGIVSNVHLARAAAPLRSFHLQDLARRRSRTRKINTSHQAADVFTRRAYFLDHFVSLFFAVVLFLLAVAQLEFLNPYVKLIERIPHFFFPSCFSLTEKPTLQFILSKSVLNVLVYYILDNVCSKRRSFVRNIYFFGKNKLKYSYSIFSFSIFIFFGIKKSIIYHSNDEKEIIAKTNIKGRYRSKVP